MEEEQQRKARRNEQNQREMYRKARDIIRIYNPLEITFKWFFDSFPYTIGPRQTKDVERYLARLYFDKMSQYLIGQMATAQGNDMIAERAKKGLPAFLDPYEENRNIWDKVPKLNDPKLLAKLADELIVGLVEEFGLDELPENPANIPQADMRNLQEKVFDSMDRKIATDLPPNQPQVKEKLAMEVSVE